MKLLTESDAKKLTDLVTVPWIEILRCEGGFSAELRSMSSHKVGVLSTARGSVRVFKTLDSLTKVAEKIGVAYVSYSFK